METLGKALLVAGIVLLVAGACALLLARFGIGRLPGDIVIRRANFTLYDPIGLKIQDSIHITLNLNVQRS